MKDLDALLREITPELALLEPARQRCRKVLMQSLGIVALPLVVGVIGISLATIDTRSIWIIGSVICLAVGFIYVMMKVGSAQNSYRAAYKQAAIPQLLGLLDPGLRYEGDGGIPKETYLGTELFTTSPDRYNSEDLITGTYGKTSLLLAEVHAEDRQTSTDSKGRSQTRYVTIFKGLLLIADFHKHFAGRTFLFPDTAESLLGNVGRFFQKMGGRSETELLRMEDPEFEKAFAVYSTDAIEARYILSTAMMERFLRLRERLGRDIRVAFKDSSVAIAVSRSALFLEPSMGTPAADPAQIESLLQELVEFLNTIEELDLNTRIWTKE